MFGLTPDRRCVRPVLHYAGESIFGVSTPKISRDVLTPCPIYNQSHKIGLTSFILSGKRIHSGFSRNLLEKITTEDIRDLGFQRLLHKARVNLEYFSGTHISDQIIHHSHIWWE